MQHVSDTFCVFILLCVIVMIIADTFVRSFVDSYKPEKMFAICKDYKKLKVFCLLLNIVGIVVYKSTISRLF